MVVLFEGEDGEQRAVDPGASGSSAGFVLSNGQDDDWSDEDTVPIGEAFRLVEHIVRAGSWPADARRVVDRSSIGGRPPARPFARTVADLAGGVRSYLSGAGAPR